MRIGIAGLSHETNTYAPTVTGLDSFRVHRGEEIRRHLEGTRTAAGGLIAAAERLGAETVLLLHAGADPSGTIAADCYAELAGELLAAVAAAGPLDVLALDLHGAAVADGVDDVEADLCRRLRAALSAPTRLIATFDLHGNVSDEMARQLDLGFACREYPHTDSYERAAAALTTAARLAASGAPGRVRVESLPLLIGAGPSACTTPPGPARWINELCLEASARPGVRDCSFFHGFVPADVPGAGAAVMVSAEDEELALLTARELAARLWERRADFAGPLLSPREAIERALMAPPGPVVVNDLGDNPGGGAPGDDTRLLRELLATGVEGVCFGVLCDPEAVAQAAAAGPGETISLRLGAKVPGGRQGEPLAVDAYVRGIGDGRFKLAALWRDLWLDMGPIASLRLDGVEVLVSSRPHQVVDPEVFLANGIDVTRFRLLAIKSAVHFRAGFEPIAAAIVAANTPGLTSAEVADFERRRAGRPLYPLDADAAYPAASAARR